MTQLNNSSNLNGIFEYNMPVHNGNRLFRPFVVSIRTHLTDIAMENLSQLAETIQNTKATSVAILPLWVKYAKDLGINLEIKFVGSLLDPNRILYKLIYYICNKMLENKTVEQYKTAFGLS